MATPRLPTDPAATDPAAIDPAATDPGSIDPYMAKGPPPIWRWIKTDCGRAKYAELAGRKGPVASLRLAWFVLIAALRDWSLPTPETRNPS